RTSDVSSRAFSLYFTEVHPRRDGVGAGMASAGYFAAGTVRSRAASANSPAAATPASARHPSHKAAGLAAYTREPTKGASMPDVPHARPTAPMYRPRNASGAMEAASVISAVVWPISPSVHTTTVSAKAQVLWHTPLSA